MHILPSCFRCEMRLVLRQMFFLALNLVLGIVGIKTTIALILVTHYLLQHNITPQVGTNRSNMAILFDLMYT